MFTVPALPAPRLLPIPPFWPAPLAKAGSGRWPRTSRTRYWRDRSDCWSLKSLNALAAKIIDARYDGNAIEEAMEAEFPPAERPDLVSRGGAAIALLPARGRLDDDSEAIDAIRYAWEDRRRAR
jgi:hypothetical protein